MQGKRFLHFLDVFWKQLVWGTVVMVFDGLRNLWQTTLPTKFILQVTNEFITRCTCVLSF